jgi:hypothetical protein
MFKQTLLLAAMILGGSYANAADIEHPVVLELFTSQGCSSCPPADALLKQLSAADANLIPLSFHIHYWDRLGWKDVYSSPVNTDRQKAYARALKDHRIFTPQLIVGGKVSVIGSDVGAVKQAIAAAMQSPPAATVSLQPESTRHALIASIRLNDPSLTDTQPDIWEVRFEREASTVVAAGENRGRTLDSINNVTSIKSLGTWSKSSNPLPVTMPASGGVAIIVQLQGQGEILGAASYLAH